MLPLVLLAVAPGCEGPVHPQPKKAASTRKTTSSKPVKTKKPSPKQPAEKPEIAELQRELDKISRAYESSRTTTRNVGFPEDQAVKRATAAIKASLELGPTLVVWLVDRTPSAQTIVSQATQAAQGYYETPDIKKLSEQAGDPLLTAVVAFGDKVEFVVDPPTGDWQKAQAGLGGVQSAGGSREQTFGAIKAALDKYLPFRTEQRRELVLIVVTDEAGDDPQVVDELVEMTRRHAIPVYAIGLPAPWGQTNPLAPNPKAGGGADNDETPTLGPESLLSERVDLAGWVAKGGGQQLDLVDSGFGPFALERLCRASRGQFFATRPGSSGSYALGGAFRFWPTGDELRFEEKFVSKYAPDYVSSAEYQKLLASSKARSALVEAAKLPRVTIEGHPESRFPKVAEAQMARQTSQAQQFAARNSPAVDRLFDVLSPGEIDRDKLTSPRWQAQFDLAMGRVMAMKVRLDGYNSMIAALKRGKTFQNSGSTIWILEPADAFETESTLRRLGERAKMYLERVVKEHPGTPWATIAEEELKSPLGWTWKES